MSKGTHEAELFRWAKRRAKWAPRRKNGFAAALAVILETAQNPAVAPAARGQRRRSGAAGRQLREPPPSAGGPSPAQARCPRCGVQGEVTALFGTRLVDGRRRPQSWCRPCRRLARDAATPPLVREAERFARRQTRAVAVDDLPLWACGQAGHGGH